MSDIHIHSTGDKIHIARADNLTPAERAIRTAVLFVVRTAEVYASGLLAQWSLLTHTHLPLVGCVAIVLLLTVAAQTWRGGYK